MASKTTRSTSVFTTSSSPRKGPASFGGTTLGRDCGAGAGATGKTNARGRTSSASAILFMSGFLAVCSFGDCRRRGKRRSSARTTASRGAPGVFRFIGRLEVFSSATVTRRPEVKLSQAASSFANHCRQCFCARIVQGTCPARVGRPSRLKGGRNSACERWAEFSRCETVQGRHHFVGGNQNFRRRSSPALLPYPRRKGLASVERT